MENELRSLCVGVEKAFKARFPLARFYAHTVGGAAEPAVGVKVIRLNGWALRVEAEELAKTLEQPDPVTDVGPDDMPYRIRHVLCDGFLDEISSQPVVFQVLHTDSEGESTLDVRIMKETWDMAVADYGTPEEAFGILAELFGGELDSLAIEEYRQAHRYRVDGDSYVYYDVVVRDQDGRVLGGFDRNVQARLHYNVLNYTTMLELHDWYTKESV